MNAARVLASAALIAALALPAPLSGAGAKGPRPIEWRTLADGPSARTEVTAAIQGGEGLTSGKVYVAGGFAAPAQTVATVDVYDPGTDSWSTGPPLPLAVNHAMGASSGGTAYIAGGYTEAGQPSARAFSLSGGIWAELPPMPEPRAAGGAAEAGGRIYVVGGVGPTGLASTTMVFDPRAGTWSLAPGLLHPREHLGVAAVGNRVYAVGGRDGTAPGLPNVEVFVPSSGRWKPLPDLPTPRGGMAATATDNGYVVAVGGEAATTFREAEAFDVKRKRWIKLPGMPTARHGLGVVALGNTVLTLMGGVTPGLSFSPVAEALGLRPLAGLRCFGRPPGVVGEPGADVITGTGRPETFFTQGGDDVVEAGGGADRVCAGGGRDEVSGQAGVDRLDGGSGRDRCPGGPGRDVRRRCERGAA